MSGGFVDRAFEVYDSNETIRLSPREALRATSDAGRWMANALEVVRGRPCVRSSVEPMLGFTKYALATLVAATWSLTLVGVGLAPLAVTGILVFYAVEAQAVFLYPVILDGAEHPWTSARRATVQAGGTVRVMVTVLPIAAVMLFGGFFGRGFIRSWCAGCIAVCLWYEQLPRVLHAQA